MTINPNLELVDFILMVTQRGAALVAFGVADGSKIASMYLSVITRLS